jgi:hypothetical protein
MEMFCVHELKTSNVTRRGYWLLLFEMVPLDVLFSPMKGNPDKIHLQK